MNTGIIILLMIAYASGLLCLIASPIIYVIYKLMKMYEKKYYEVIDLSQEEES